MSRINTNIPALLGTRILNQNTAALNKSLERLSTGLRINRGADDPADLIASENLRKQIRGTETAVKNAERAANIVSTAEGALQEVSSMLLDVQALLSEVANKGGMSIEEIDANQSQVDSIINSVNRIANTTEFAGIKLLDGNLDYSNSGVIASSIAEVNVRSAKLIDGAEMAVNVNVINPAETGRAFISGSSLSDAMTIQIGSNLGTTELTFAASSTNISGIASAINAVKEITGVSATESSATNFSLESVDFGSDAFVSVTILSGQANNVGATEFKNATGGTTVSLNSEFRDFGVNVAATVNGASVIGTGKVLSIRTAILDAEIDLTLAGATSTTSYSFTITGGGSNFLLGADVTSVGLEPFGIQSVVASRLGNATDGFLNTLRSGGTNSLSNINLITAQKVLNSAINDVTSLRGRLGNFQRNTLETTVNSLRITNENLQAAESALRDTDFAAETSNLTRNQILVSAATNVLAQANFAPQSVLSLLG